MTSTLKIASRMRAALPRSRWREPERHNALNAAMMDELHEAARSLGADAAVRVVVLAAEGESFCAGGDLGWMRAQFDSDRAGPHDGSRAACGDAACARRSAKAPDRPRAGAPPMAAVSA